MTVALPYDDVKELLIVSNSANNRILVLDAEKNKFIEQIGSGKAGFEDG